MHLDNKHADNTNMLGLISQDWYICGVKRLLRKILRQCITCRKEYAVRLQQKMGQLPCERVQPTSPFHSTGIDMAGLFSCKKNSTRNSGTTKAWACLFVCLATRAIHIEVVSDMTTASFIAALRHFCSRKGAPRGIFSDNGTDLTGAARELHETFQDINNSILKELTKYEFQNIEWKFSPPGVPHFGGLWEAGVRSMKTLLRKSIGTHPLAFEELATVLAEIEAILNSRPMERVEALPEDGLPILTPGHFLIGRPIKAPAPQLLDQPPFISTPQ